MAAISISVNGVDKVLAGLEALAPKYQRAIGKEIRDGAKACFNGSQDDCPVGESTYKSTYHRGAYQGEEYTHKAGTLKGSGNLNIIDDFNAEVSYGGPSSTGENCDYAMYVEMGTSKMAAQPFLYPNFLYACELISIGLQSIATQNDITSQM